MALSWALWPCMSYSTQLKEFCSELVRRRAYAFAVGVIGVADQLGLCLGPARSSSTSREAKPKAAPAGIISPLRGQSLAADHWVAPRDHLGSAFSLTYNASI